MADHLFSLHTSIEKFKLMVVFVFITPTFIQYKVQQHPYPELYIPQIEKVVLQKPQSHGIGTPVGHCYNLTTLG